MQNRHNGFTLMELLVTTVIVAVIAALGIPTFQRAASTLRVNTAANDLVLAIQEARSMALQRRMPVEIVPTARQLNWNRTESTPPDQIVPGVDEDADVFVRLRPTDGVNVGGNSILKQMQFPDTIRVVAIANGGLQIGGTGQASTIADPAVIIPTDGNPIITVCDASSGENSRRVGIIMDVSSGALRVNRTMANGEC